MTAVLWCLVWAQLGVPVKSPSRNFAALCGAAAALDAPCRPNSPWQGNELHRASNLAEPRRRAPDGQGGRSVGLSTCEDTQAAPAVLVLTIYAWNYSTMDMIRLLTPPSICYSSQS